MSLLDDLNWRYATKKMDPTKKVSEVKLTQIKEAVRLAASSYGLQPYKVLDIQDPELRLKLKPLCWNQSQIVDASHVLVFCNYIDFREKDIDNMMRLKTEISGLDPEKVVGYGNFVKGKLKEKSKEEMFHWTAKQAYIALGNALMACAELKIDSTPMEGFETAQVNELLQLEKENLNACVMLAIGYRSAEDSNQYAQKVRRASEDLFKTR
jgi:nitroreductase/dihydropteridine reductase